MLDMAETSAACTSQDTLDSPRASAIDQIMPYLLSQSKRRDQARSEDEDSISFVPLQEERLPDDWRQQFPHIGERQQLVKCVASRLVSLCAMPMGRM